MFINLKIPSKESIRFIKREQMWGMKSDLTQSNITVLATRENLENTLNLLDSEEKEFKNIKQVVPNFYVGRLDYIKCVFITNEFCVGNYCDCCGKSLNIFNRDKEINSLCKDCNSSKYILIYLENYKNNFYRMEHINLEYFE